jgi:hypothetical protein
MMVMVVVARLIGRLRERRREACRVFPSLPQISWQSHSPASCNLSFTLCRVDDRQPHKHQDMGDAGFFKVELQDISGLDHLNIASIREE